MHKDHKDELWRFLQANPGWHTSKELAVIIGVSDRSIKRYAKDLADIAAISVSKKGYRISQSKIASSKTHQDIESNYSNIKRVILNNFTQSPTQNVYDLAEKYFLSTSTIINLLLEIKEYAAQFALSLHRHGDEWTLTGSEINKRRIISDLLYRESTQSLIDAELIQKSFSDVNVPAIKNIIQHEALVNDVYLNQFDFNNVLLHVVIAVHRVKNGFQTKKETSEDSSSSLHINNIITNNTFGHNLISEVESTEKIEFSLAENKSLMLVIHFSITRDNHNFTESTDANVVELVNNLINYVNSIFNIDLRVLNFQEQFTIHIQRLIERSSQGFVERNPMTSTIRKSSPMIYECAVLIANQLEERTHLKIADDEIAYIAMHIGNAVSEYIKDLHKLFVVVLIPEYQNSDNELVSRLERLFNQDVVVGRIVHSTEDLQSDKLSRKIDFVIQVNSIETIAEFRHTNISQFLTQSDYQRVNTMIQTIKREKESTNFIENLRRFFPEENFKILRGINNRDAVLRSVTDHLYKRGVVTENFYEQLLKRESMSSTAFGHIAIPHSLRMTAKKTEGFVIVAPRGIHWDNNTTLVNLVFLLAIQKNNNSAYRNIFDDISQIMIEPKNIAMLVQAKNYRDFVKILTSLQ